MFISFDGLDGSGKTTQMYLMADLLRRSGFKVHTTREPSDGPVGFMIRTALTKRIQVTPETLALLFSADRLDHIENEINPKLAKGFVVLTDRYTLSSCYQMVNIRGDWVGGLDDYSLLPDLSILVDVPVRVAMDRIDARGSDRELFEKRSWLLSVRKMMLKENTRLTVCENQYGKVQVNIDGDAPVNLVHETIVEAIKSVFPIPVGE